MREKVGKEGDVNTWGRSRMHNIFLFIFPLYKLCFHYQENSACMHIYDSVWVVAV